MEWVHNREPEQSRVYQLVIYTYIHVYFKIKYSMHDWPTPQSPPQTHRYHPRAMLLTYVTGISHLNPNL